MSAPERIWVDDDGYWFDIDPSETRPEYIRKDASDAAIAAARADAEQWQQAFAAQTRKLQAAMYAGGDAVRQAIRAAAEAQP